jgi:hypothetical protein
MNTNEYIKLHSDLGFRIIQTQSANWLVNENGYAHSFPTLDVVNPATSDFDEVFKARCRFLLFRSCIDNTNTCEYIFANDKYDLVMFDSKIRNQIRKGINSCVIKDADADSIIKKGLAINRATLGRQKRITPYLINENIWKRYITNFLGRKDIHVKGAFFNNELIGYIIFIKLNERYIILHPFRDDTFSALNPINAILFTFINEVIEKENKIEITYGLSSFSEMQGLDKFKSGMLFSKEPGSRLAVFSPSFGMLFNKTFHSISRSMKKIKPLSSPMSVYGYLYEANQLFKKYYR